MKHGPIALIDSEMPVVSIAPNDHVFEKMLGNIQEVKARGGSVIAVTTDGHDTLKSILDPAVDVADLTSARARNARRRLRWYCRCNCSRITSPSAAAATSISREISRRASR